MQSRPSRLHVRILILVFPVGMPTLTCAPDESLSSLQSEFLFRVRVFCCNSIESSGGCCHGYKTAEAKHDCRGTPPFPGEQPSRGESHCIENKLSDWAIVSIQLSCSPSAFTPINAVYRSASGQRDHRTLTQVCSVQPSQADDFYSA
jgi:hypothetical protein